MISDTAKGQIIKELFPYAGKGMARKLRTLSTDKNIWDRLERELNNVMGSIIRHNATHYDKAVKQVPKCCARYFVNAEVTNILAEMKGR